MKKRQLWIGIIIIVLIPILVPLITLPRAKADILRSLQASLGRRITASAVHLQLLPLPGVALDNVSLSDAPAFGLEDMVMAERATANISLWNLLWGHLVFAHVHLQSPSINLVRDAAGQWNIVALLDRAGPPHAGGGGRSVAARFPYVDWSDARVNFKFDQTKTHFYLDQVQGSLAREHSSWRLHLSFVPARSDLNLSNTGVVTMDGRWQASAGGLQNAPFALAVHLRNSYLAGSSALLVGHDAGIHGVLSADLRAVGTGRQFTISGTASAQSLRRWDLLPTSASVRATFAARYTPQQDRLQIEGIGDPGWKHVQLSGLVLHLFAHPKAVMALRLNDFAAANLLPLAEALKANLPASLLLAGRLSGTARFQWAWGNRLPQGRGAVQFAHLNLSSNAASLSLPKAALTWNGHQLRLPAVAASFARHGGPGARIRMSGTLDQHGFDLAFDSPALTGPATGALARLLGLSSPWPPRVNGTAQLALRLAAPWSQFREAHWSGKARFARARFQPPGSSGLELRPLAVDLSAGGPVRARFALAAIPAHGTVVWTPGAGVSFSLAGRGVHSKAFWALLHPAPGDLIQQMFGAVLGGTDAAPAWLRQLQANGNVRFDDLVWNGIHAGLQMRLAASPDAWRATRLVIHVGGGQFSGHGRLREGDFDIDGSVAPAHPLRLQPVLAPTPYAGRLTGALSGSLTLVRPLSGGDVRHVTASGTVLIRHGRLATATGPWAFQR
ncbi:MAG: AsmA family protein, partial [Terriglobales bacterium]